MHSTPDFDRSYKRLTDAEDLRRDQGGFGDTKQGHALLRVYLPQLAETIDQDRTSRYRDMDVWRSLRGKTDNLAARLLWAGITAAVDDVTHDPDDAGNTLQGQAIFIAHNLGCHRQDLGPKVGLWGIKILESLPIFDVDDVLTLGADVEDFTGGVLWRAVKDNPLLFPRTTPPEPWTQVRRGGLPADHWAAGGSLIRGHRRANEKAMREAIRTGEMQPVLDDQRASAGALYDQ
jgi:hypothetical protein